ncbi:MAG: hypothetical protein WCC37_06130, partial [Candidatus Sulfotelmatobacter sp.]
ANLRPQLRGIRFMELSQSWPTRKRGSLWERGQVARALFVWTRGTILGPASIAGNTTEAESIFFPTV